MASKKFNGNVPISLRDMLQESAAIHGINKPNEMLIYILEIDNMIDKQMLSHIYDNDSGRSYQEIPGTKEKLIEDLRDPNNSIQIDEVFKKSVFGDTDLTIRTRESSSNPGVFGEFISLVGSVMSRLQDGITKSTRKNFNNVLSFGENAKQQQIEQKAAEKNAQADMKANEAAAQAQAAVRMYEEKLAVERSEIENKRQEELAKEEIAKQDEIKRLEEQYSEKIYEIDNEINELKDSYNVALAEYETIVSSDTATSQEIDDASAKLELTKQEYFSGESIHNEKINEISKERNNLLDEINSKYETSISSIDTKYKNISIEKENEYISNVNVIMKDYDDKISEIKRTYNLSKNYADDIRPTYYGDNKNTSPLNNKTYREDSKSIQFDKSTITLDTPTNIHFISNDTNSTVNLDSGKDVNYYKKMVGGTINVKDLIAQAQANSKIENPVPNNSSNNSVGDIGASAPSIIGGRKAEETFVDDSSKINTGYGFQNVSSEKTDSFLDESRLNQKKVNALLDRVLNGEAVKITDTDSTSRIERGHSLDRSKVEKHNSSIFSSGYEDAQKTIQKQNEEAKTAINQTQRGSYDKSYEQDKSQSSHYTGINGVDWTKTFREIAADEYKSDPTKVAEKSQQEYENEYGSDKKPMGFLEYNVGASFVINRVAGTVGMEEIGSVISAGQLVATFARDMYKEIEKYNQGISAFGSDETYKGIDDFNNILDDAAASAKENSSKYDSATLRKIAMENAVNSFGTTFESVKLNALHGNTMNSAIALSGEGKEFFNAIDSAQESNISGIHYSPLQIGESGQSILETNRQRVAAASMGVGMSSAVAKFAVNGAFEAIRDARLGMDSNFNGFQYFSLYSRPIAAMGAGTVRSLICHAQAENMLNKMDFEKVANLMRNSNTSNTIRLLDDEAVKHFGRATFEDIRNGSVLSKDIMDGLKKQMFEKYAKNGGYIYAEKEISILTLNLRKIEINKMLKTTTDTKLIKELGEELVHLNTLIVAGKLQSSTVKSMLGGGIKGITGSFLTITVARGFTDDTGRSMTSAGITSYNSMKGSKKAYNALKNSKLMRKAANIANNPVNKFLTSGSKASQAVGRGAKVVGNFAGKGLNAIDNVGKATKTTRKISKTARRLRKVGTNANKIRQGSRMINTLARGVANITKTLANVAHTGAHVAGLASGAGTAGAAGAAAGGAGAAGLGALTVGTGGIALIVIIIVAIILCCCCCLCSFGAGYNTYSQVDSFYITNVGDSHTGTDAANSLAAYEIAFMDAVFEQNYPTFIFNGVESFIDEIMEAAGDNYIVPDYTANNGLEHEKGRITIIKPDEDLPHAYGHYILVREPNSIYYSDVDHFIQFDIANYNIQVDENSPTIYSVPPTYIVTEATANPDASASDTESRVYNEKEIIAMASVTLQNDLDNTAGNVSNRDCATFAFYSNTMWEESHYCVHEQESSGFFGTIGSFFKNLFNSIVDSLFGSSTQLSNIEEYYTKVAQNNAGNDDGFIKITHISLDWDPGKNISENPNLVIALNENEYAPEQQHYVGTPLKFNTDDISDWQDMTSDEIFSGNDEYKESIILDMDWDKSDKLYYNSILLEDGEIIGDGARSQIESSIFKTKEISAIYKYGQYEIDMDKVEEIIEDFIDAAIENAPGCECGFICGCSDCSCADDNAEAAEEGAKENWEAAFEGKIESAEKLLSSGIVVINETENGLVFETEDEAKMATKDVVDLIYDQLEKNFGEITNDMRGKLLFDVIEGAYETDSKNITVEEISMTVTTGKVDASKLGEAFQTNKSSYDEYYNTSCLQIKIPYGEGFDGVDIDKQGYTTREDAIQMVDDAYTNGAITKKYQYLAQKTITSISVPEYGNLSVGVTMPKEETYIMLFAPKSPIASAPSIDSGRKITFKDIYKQYFICGGHTKLAIEPVTLTFNGSKTMFDIVNNTTGGQSIYELMQSKDLLFDLKFTDENGTIINEWNIGDAMGRENILNAVTMVDENWQQKYGFSFENFYDLSNRGASLSGYTFKSSDGKTLIEPLTFSLYKTDTEVLAAANSKLGVIALEGSSSRDKMAMTYSIDSVIAEVTKTLKAADGSLDINGDDLINKEDYDAAMNAGNIALARNITSAINRIDRCALALGLVGKVGYTQTAHDYTSSGPLRSNWSYKNLLGDPELIKLLDLGDEYDIGLVYKSDCSGFVSYIMGWDTSIVTSNGVMGGAPGTVALPDKSSTIVYRNINELDTSAISDAEKDPLIEAIYASGNSITYPSVSIDWNSPSSYGQLKPGDAVAKSGHVMVYLGPAPSGGFFFVELTGSSKIGPGSVVLSIRTGSSLAGTYTQGVQVDYDLRSINLDNN